MAYFNGCGIEEGRSGSDSSSSLEAGPPHWAAEDTSPRVRLPRVFPQPASFQGILLASSPPLFSAVEQRPGLVRKSWTALFSRSKEKNK